ncbi:MAG: nitrate/nitrite transporter [Agathobacter sp.]
MAEKKNASSIPKNKSMFSFGVKGWGIILFCIVCYFILSWIGNDASNIFVPILGAEGYDPGTVYSLISVAGWISVPFIFVGGVIARKSNKVTLLIGFACAIIGCFLFGAVGAPWQILVVLSLFQIAVNTAIFLGTSNLIANWFPTRKGPAMGWATVGASLNSALNPTIWSMAIPFLGGGLLGLGGIFRIWGIIILVLFIITLLVIKQNPEEAKAFPDNDSSITPEQARKDRELGIAYTKSSPWTVKKLLTCKMVWIIAIASGIIMMITMGIMSNLIAIIMSYGVAQPGALKIITLASVIGIFFSVLWGKVDAVKGTKWATIVFYIIMICAMVLFLVPSIGTMFIGCILVACALGAGNNLAVSLTVSVFGRYDFTKAWGIIYPIHVIVRAAGFMLVGVISSATGSYKPAFLAMIGCAVIAVILMVFFRDELLGRNVVTDEELENLKM